MDVEMKVSGMSNDHEEREIKDTIEEFQGVEHVEIHIDHGIVKVSYDQEEVSLMTICRAIEKLGYIIEN